MPPPQRRTLLENLSDEEAALLASDWRFWARDAQLPPAKAANGGEWRIWLFLGGRGAGKTRSGAEWIAGEVRAGRMARVGLIGATMRDCRAVMVEGESGLLNVEDGLIFEPSNNRVLWPGGAVATLLSAEEPDSFRGHQFDGCWGDELCKWRDPQAALDMALMAMRLGENPRMMLTTTPRNIPALTALMAAPDVAVTKSRTADNQANLADGFHDAMQARYGFSTLGRQELDGELIADHDGALWKRGWIEKARMRDVPPLERIVVAVDPPASNMGDECGIVVAGRSYSEFYVLADLSAGGLTPAGWAARVMTAFADFNADAVIAEANQGGEMVRSVLQQADANAPIRLVHASRGKITRAAPFAALYEAGRVHHAGRFAELEDQMCHYDGGRSAKSPDRMDALVWALADLAGRPADPRIRKL
ncbi:MAG TPA: terminase family protein [Rhizomicrobium sp.]|nr:terminase family protein [Rhizomicrobium sp.]